MEIITRNVSELRNPNPVNIKRKITFRLIIRFYWIIEPIYRTIFKTILFVCIVIFIGILTVCLTALEIDDLCQSNFVALLDQRLMEYNSNPCFIATGDFNHDKFLDIVVANPDTDNIGIFFNYGNGSFMPQKPFLTGHYSRPLSVAVGDFNNDTNLDIAVTNYNTHNIGIYLGHENGTFANQMTFFTNSSRPISLAIGDFNNDHWLDIVFTNNGTDNIGIFFGYGNGSFGNQTTYSTGYDSFPYSVVVNDFNNDHYLDIAVTNYGTDNIGIFLGYGNGSFTTQIIYYTSLRSNPYAIAVNDINNDGQLDIVVANSGTNDVSIFLGNEHGDFLSSAKYLISSISNPHSIIIADFNRDNQLDIAVSNYGTDDIGILIGYGNGSFAIPTMHSTGIDSRPLGIVAGDFNNDNQSDIGVTSSNTNNILILIGYYIEQSDNPTTYYTGINSLPMYIAIGDLNNDTKSDLVVANSGTNNIGIFFGYGNGSFRQQIVYSTGVNSHPTSLAISDLDNDNRLDIAVGNPSTQCLGILYGYGDGTFTPIITHSIQDLASIDCVTVNDLNNDTYLDVIFLDYGTNTIGIFLGLGNRTFSNLTTLSSGDGSRPFGITVEDFNNDNRLDIAVACYGTHSILVFLGFDNVTFILFSNYSTDDSSLPYMLTAADLNNDSYFDLIVVNSGTNNVCVFFGFGNGSFGTQQIYSTGLSSTPLWVSVADLNNDYSLDLAVVNSNTNNVGVLLGNPQGYFSNQTTYSTGINSYPNGIAIGDFNKDNRLDVAVVNSGTNNIAILLGHPTEDSLNLTVNTTSVTSDVPIMLGDYGANFLSQTAYSTGASSLPYALAVGDLNNDTKMDIIVTNSGDGNFGIFFGVGNGKFTTEMIYSAGIGYNIQNVIVDDFDKDTRLDVAITDPRNDNIFVLLENGNGSFSIVLMYSIDPGSSPSALAVGYFDTDIYPDLVVANMGADTIGIFFGFDYTTFTRQTPCDSGNVSDPTSVVVADVNNDGHLDIIAALLGTNNVGIFLGYGNGTFASLITYGYIHASHPWSAIEGDFNNDNQLDIAVAYWGIDSIGVLLGYGNGNFTDPIVYSSGTGARPVSIAVGDFNNDNCLDITVANYGTNNIAIFLGYGNGTFQNGMTFSTGQGSGPNSVTVADINNDSQLDIIVANGGTNNIGIFLGYGNGSFAEQMISSTGTDSYPWYAIAGDFDKDGRLDLAIANYGTRTVAVLYGYGNGSFGNLQMYTTSIAGNPTYLDLGDFNNDNQLDIIFCDANVGNVGIFFGYSDGTFARISTVLTGEDSYVNAVAIGDFNNDSRPDFTIANGGHNNVGVYLSTHSKPFGGQTSFFVGDNSQPSSVVVGYFNNDTHLDIAITNYGTDSISILWGNGDRDFTSITTYSTGANSHPISLALGDLNNDSLTDIVVASSNTDNIGVFIAYNDGSFSSLITYPMHIGSTPVSVAVGDFNRDYQLDIVVANFGTNNVCILFGYGNGTFTNQTWHPLGYNSRPNWIVFQDLNNDGWEDIAIVTSGIDNIKILFNLC